MRGNLRSIIVSILAIGSSVAKTARKIFIDKGYRRSGATGGMDGLLRDGKDVVNICSVSNKDGHKQFGEKFFLEPIVALQRNAYLVVRDAKNNGAFKFAM